MRIDLSNIIRQYGEKTALSIPSLEIEQGRITGFIGLNGSGKSTLLRIIAGLDREYQGTVLYDGKAPDGELYKMMTLVFQKPYLINTDVYGNLAYPLKLRGLGKAEIQNRVETVSRLLQLESLLRQPSHTLSGGEVQKAALARALVFEPKVLLLDEPTANIDPQSTLVMENALRHANKSLGTTVILVTHNIRQLQRLCSRAVLMQDGRAACYPSVEALFSDIDNTALGGFLSQELLI